VTPFPALRAFYFVHYGAVAVLLSYFSPYLRGLGFTGEQIGAAWAPAQIVAGPAALLWGVAADRLGATSRALRVSTAGAIVAVAALPLARTPLAMGAVLFVHSVFSSATVPLVDSVAMEAVHARPGASYSRTRLFGSLGFIAVAQALGLWLGARGDRAADALVPRTLLALALAGAGVAWSLPSAPPLQGVPRLRDAAALWRGPLPLLLIVCAVHWAACAPYHLLFGVLLRDRGLPSELTGTGMALGVLAEVGVLYSFHRLARRFSLSSLLAFAFAVSAIRWLLVARATSPWALVGLQILHGATFGVFWAAAVAAMARIVPAPLRATGQSLFSAVVFSIGNAAGYALAGAGYDFFGSAGPLFAIAGAVELGNLALVVLLGSLLPRSATATE
jgi:PPP family 3-phenylpropionic acid transporter